MNILIGTKNAYKATEMAQFLTNIPNLKILYLKNFNFKINVKEDQLTLKENAKKKAKAISKLGNWHVLTSDGGVNIPGLGKRWDILRNQRTVGENKTDLEKANKLLSLMKGLEGEKRRAHYYLALALAQNGKVYWSTQGITDRGYIAKKLPSKKIPPYRWMGHIWYYPQFKKTFNHLNDSEKEKIREVGQKIKNELRERIEKIVSCCKS